MMDWILDLYEQTENLFIIVSIILIMVSLYFVYIVPIRKLGKNLGLPLRVEDYDEVGHEHIISKL